MSTKKVKIVETIKEFPFVVSPSQIIALDMSLEHTGIANVEEDLTISTTLIEPNKGLKGNARLLGPKRISEIKKQLFIENINRNSIVFIEGYAFGAKGDSAISLGELGGVIRTSLYEAGFPYIEVPPTVLKKFITGKGNAPKEIMLKEVYKLFKFDTDNNNLADAYALAQFGLAVYDRSPLKLNAS